MQKKPCGGAKTMQKNAVRRGRRPCKSTKPCGGSADHAKAQSLAASGDGKRRKEKTKAARVLTRRFITDVFGQFFKRWILKSYLF